MQTEYTLVLVLVVVGLAVAIALLAKPVVRYHDDVTRPATSPVL